MYYETMNYEISKDLKIDTFQKPTWTNAKKNNELWVVCSGMSVYETLKLFTNAQLRKTGHWSHWEVKRYKKMILKSDLWEQLEQNQYSN